MVKRRNGRPLREWLFWSLLLVSLLTAAWAIWWLLENDAVVALAGFNRWLADNLIAKMGYLGVFGLMAIESSFIPFPSEIVMPPAGDLARRDPSWSIELVILSGVAGSLAGAYVNYFLARHLGRSLLTGLITRYGHYVRLSLEGYLKAERFFFNHGAISTLVGRLLPGIRQVVSLPAGLARMNLALFTLLTALGAGVWVAILAYLGYWFGQQPELLSQELKAASRWVVLAAVVLLGGYLVWHHLRAKRRARR